MKKITKLFNNQRMRSFDEKTRTVEFIISDNSIDRYGDIVEQDWNLKNYWNNPVLLWGHDPTKVENVLGKCLEINTEEADDRTFTTAKFQLAEAGTSAGVDTVFKLIQQGILRTVSVGFISHETNVDNEQDDAVRLKSNELLEVSVVPIPANPNAIALSYEDGSLNGKDVKFMERSLENALDLVKKSVCGTIEVKNNSKKNNQKEFQMTEEDIKKIVEALMAELTPALEALKAKEPEEEEEPKDETPETSPETEEETPEEEEEEEKAKSKQIDEDGAFDENEELDEEAEKAFIAELEKEFEKQTN